MTVHTDYDPDEIDLVKLVKKTRLFLREVWDNRRLVFKLTAVCTTIGLFLALGSAEEFTATTKLLPYRNGSSGASDCLGLRAWQEYVFRRAHQSKQ